MIIIFSCWKQLENNIHIFAPPCNIFYILLYGQKSEQANREHSNTAGKHTRYIFFHIFASQNMENTSV